MNEYINRQAQRAELSLLLAQLDRQLVSYRIVDYYGKSFAIIQDFYYDSQKQINLLINSLAARSKSDLRKINFDLIHKVDLFEKKIIVNFNSENFEQLPLYQPNQFNQSQRLTMNNNQIDHNKLEEHQISLLEERLVVNRSQQKVGEIVVRKQIETKIIEVPLRREILLIEQVEPETKLLATIDLEEENFDRSNSDNTVKHPTQYVVKGEFNSFEAASRILHQMSQLPSSDRHKIMIEIVVDNFQQQALYQQALLDRQTNQSF